jgi:hypothetical protein
VKSPAAFPLQRVALAVALSLLAHGLLLWQLPALEPAVNREILPALQAKLEPLPKLAARPVARKPRVKPSARPKPGIKPVVETPSISAASSASAVPAEASEAAATESAAPATADETVSHPRLPKHAQLHFTVQYGNGTFKVGEVIHVLENTDGRYTLRAETQTTGLASIFKSYQLTQTSTGTVSRQGLRPENYVEIKTDGSGTQTSSASINWDTHKVYFNNGKERSLTEQAQDRLSLPYQLSQLPLNTDSVPVELINSTDIRQHYLAIGDEGTISTPLGELRTIALHKVHGANEDGLIIWLALEYRLLPVKILYLDRSGEISANMVITDIRVSDE